MEKPVFSVLEIKRNITLLTRIFLSSLIVATASGSVASTYEEPLLVKECHELQVSATNGEQLLIGSGILSSNKEQRKYDQVSVSRLNVLGEVKNRRDAICEEANNDPYENWFLLLGTMRNVGIGAAFLSLWGIKNNYDELKKHKSNN